MKPALRLLNLLLVTALAAPAAATPVPVGASALSITNPVVLTPGTVVNTSVGFDIAASGVEYPPAAFPAFYPATTLPASELDLRVYNNRAGLQALKLTAVPFSGGLRLDQLEYRVDGGPWLRASLEQNASLLAQSGWQTYRIEFRLRLDGTETAGQYQTSLIWQLGSAAE